MSNIELARKIAQHMTGDPVTARDIAQELADAGLLAPELPAPNDPDTFAPDAKGWLLDDENGPVVWTAPGSPIMVQRIEPGELTPSEARVFAHQTLAAANHSEHGHDPSTV